MNTWIGQFLAGLAAVPRAAALLLRTPRLRRLAVVPTLLSLLIFFVLALGSLHWGGALLNELWPVPVSETGWLAGLLYFLHGIARVLTSAALILFSAVVALVLSFVIGEPFVDLLTGATEKALGRVAPEADGWSVRGLWTDMVHTALDVVVDLVLFIALQAALLLFFLVPMIGPLLHFGSGLVASAFFSGAEMTSPALGRRGFHGTRRWRVVCNRAPAVLGFGFGVLVLLSIPLAQVMILPVAVVAGTLLVHEKDAPGPA